MSEIPPFSGFPEDGLTFLEELAHNNNREWFEAHRQRYVDNLQSPAQALVAALGSRLQALSEGIIYDTRTNGGGSLMRIHRDTRFSKDKTPYKTAIAMMFWEGAGKKTENPGFGLHMTAAGAGLMAGMHRFPPPMLDAYRAAVADESPGAELEAALKAVSTAGDYAIGGEHFKRVPRGYDADHPRADLLRHDALYVDSPPINRATLTTPGLVDVCMAHFEKMAPVQRWLVKVAQRMTG